MTGYYSIQSCSIECYYRRRQEGSFFTHYGKWRSSCLVKTLPIFTIIAQTHIFRNGGRITRCGCSGRNLRIAKCRLFGPRHPQRKNDIIFGVDFAHFGGGAPVEAPTFGRDGIERVRIWGRESCFIGLAAEVADGAG